MCMYVCVCACVCVCVCVCVRVSEEVYRVSNIASSINELHSHSGRTVRDCMHSVLFRGSQHTEVLR
jgi:hypothetical protein